MGQAREKGNGEMEKGEIKYGRAAIVEGSALPGPIPGTTYRPGARLAACGCVIARSAATKQSSAFETARLDCIAPFAMSATLPKSRFRSPAPKARGEGSTQERATRKLESCGLAR
jgi:hypothetical protein